MLWKLAAFVNNESVVVWWESVLTSDNNLYSSMEKKGETTGTLCNRHSHRVKATADKDEHVWINIIATFLSIAQTTKFTVQNIPANSQRDRQASCGSVYLNT